MYLSMCTMKSFLKYLILLFYLYSYTQCDVIIECVTNCPLADPKKEFVVKYSCTEGCEKYNLLDWSIIVKKKNTRQNYAPGMINKNREKQTITISANVQFTDDVLPLALQEFINKKAGPTLATYEITYKCAVNDTCPGEPLHPEDQYDDDLHIANEMTGASPKEIMEKILEIRKTLVFGINKKSAFYIRGQKEIMANLLHLPLNTQHDLTTAKEMLDFATKTPSGILTASQAVLASMVQKKITDSQLEIVKKALEPGKMAGEIDLFAKDVLDTIAKVATVEGNFNSDIVQVEYEDDIVENENFPTENYQMYLDFDVLSAARLKNIQRTTLVVTNIVKNVGKTTLITMKNKEKKRETINEGTCILSLLNEKKQTAEEMHSICNATLLLTTPLLTELNTNFDSVGITFSVIKQKIFEWMLQKANAQYVFINIVDMKDDANLTVLNNPIIFSTPVNVTIGKEKSNTFDMTTNSFTDADIVTHKLFILSSIQMLLIKFTKMDPADKFRVVVILNRRPNMNDFDNHTPIPNLNENSMDKYAILQQVVAINNSFCYVGILPEMGQNAQKKFAYKVKFTKLACETWLDDNLIWNSSFCAVGPETNLGRITCYCTHLSLFATTAEDIISEVVHNADIMVELNDYFCYYVIISLAIVVLIFFLLLLLVIWRNRYHIKTKVVLFLLDNELSFTHEYYVVVYTGTDENAQTTSNITFKMYGTKSESLTHLLKGQHEPIFQKGSEDWFYLLTEKEIGDITSIDLWSDCYGCRLSWFCDKIEVYQISTRQKWLFQIRTWISALNHKVVYSTKVIVVETPIFETRWQFAIRGLQEHLWIKSFQKCTMPAFSYYERIATMLSIVVCNMSMCLCLLVRPTHFFISMKLGYGVYYFGLYEFGLAFASAGITFVIHWFVIYVFSNAETVQTKDVLCTTQTRFSKLWRITTWICLLIVVLGNIAFLSIFGLWVEKTSSLVWLTTWGTAVAICIILFETMNCMITAMIQRKFEDIKLKLDISEVLPTKQKIEEKYGNQGLRPFFKSYYSPISRIEENIRMETELQRVAARRLCSDIMMFSLYIVILFLVVLLNKDSTTNFSGRDVEKMFIFDKYEKTYGTAAIITQRGLYNYLKFTLVPNLYCHNWYARYTTHEGGLVVNFNTKMLGVPRLRQIRIKNHTCHVVESMLNITRVCNLEYNFAIEETKDFGPRWQEKINDGSLDDMSDLIWHYQSASSTNSRLLTGQLATYPAGGYVVPLGRIKNNTVVILRYIEHREWIDVLTRAIFIDINFYNANENLFNMLAIIIERSASGKFIVNYLLQTTRLLYLDPIAQVTKFSTLLFLMVFMLVFTWHKIRRAARSKRKKLRQAIEIWNMVDFLIVLLALCFIGMFFYRSGVVNDLLKALENARHNQYVSFNSALYLDFVVDILAALLVTISTIRLWRLLRFLKIFRVVELTMNVSWIYLFSFTIINVVVIFSYSIVGHMLFGASCVDFKDLTTSFLTVTLLAFHFHSNFDYKVFVNTTLNLGYFYYMGCTVMFLIIVSIFVTLIIVSYQAAKEVYDAKIEEKLISYSLPDFIRDEYRYFKSKTCGRLDTIRLSGGVENVTQAVDDDDECEQTTRKVLVARKKVSIREKKVKEMNDIFSNAYSLFTKDSMWQDKNMKTDNIMHILSHSYKKTPHNVVEEGPHRLFIQIPHNDSVKYCSLKRMEEMKLIVEYLLSRQKNQSLKRRETTARLENKQDTDAQERMITQMNTSIFDTIKHIKGLMNKTYADKSTNVFFEDLGLEEVFD